jgi:hypothetical protein
MHSKFERVDRGVHQGGFVVHRAMLELPTISSHHLQKSISHFQDGKFRIEKLYLSEHQL